MQTIAIFGKGWLGTILSEKLQASLLGADITDRKAVAAALDQFHPAVVINAAGKTGRPNIDWCETHREETFAANVTGVVVLAQECALRGIKFVHLSSGCIFDGAPPRPEGFSEEDGATPLSFYARTKVKAEEELRSFPALIIRLRMPVDTAPHPRNLITKLAGYPQIADVANSITIVPDLIITLERLIKERRSGVYHVVNPGAIRHAEILELYREIVDSAHRYELIPPEDLLLRGLVKTGRSACRLSTRKLEREGIYLPPIKERIKEILREYGTYRTKFPSVET